MRSSSKGFSLIELLIALGVIGVLTSLATSFITNVSRDSSYRAKVTEGRNDLKQLLARLSTLMVVRDPHTPVLVTPTSLTLAAPRDETLPVAYYKVQIHSSCRSAPGGGAGFVIAPNSKGQSCYEQLACPGQLPYVEVRHIAHPTRTTERFPNDTQFARVLNSENALAGFAFCMQNLPSSYTVKGIAAITKPSDDGQPTVQLIEESLILPKAKRNAVNIVPD